MKRLILLFILIAVFIFSASKIISINSPFAPEKKTTNSFIGITPQNLAEKDLFIGQKTVAIVDLRSNAEYLAKRISGSIKRSPADIISSIPDFELNYLTLVFVSEDGAEAKTAAQAVANNSTTFSSKQIFVLSGGMAAWNNANLPTVSTP